MKVDAMFVKELRREVVLQITRLRRLIQEQGTRESWEDSLYRLKKLKMLLDGLLADGELVIVSPREVYSNDGQKSISIRVIKKLAKFFRFDREDEEL